MANHGDRPKRVLAAWGYESGTSGDRVEVDVWTVNRPRETDGENDAIRRARNAFGGRVERVIAAYGNVARVSYAGAAGEGYRYIDSNEKAPQQAFAGAKRHAGGSPDAGGRMTEGYDPPPGEPDIERAITHGERKVIPPLQRQANGSLAANVGREPSRDEEGEPVETAPFDGFANVIRFFTRGGVQRYHVENGSVRRGTGPRGGSE